MILVVGATGQLGTAVVHKARASGHAVRALVRPSSAFEHLRGLPGVEIRLGDLRDPRSLAEACAGASAVVATATATFPRGRYSFEDDERRGYRSLLDACRDHGVGQFLFVSLVAPFRPPYTTHVPTVRLKHEIEQMAEDSGVPYTIFRAVLFMDDYFALLGSQLPLRGAEAATLRRPFWFSRSFLRAVGSMIDRHGLALAPGRRDMRHSFIALDDVASFLVKAVGHPAARNATFEIGGPRLSWSEVAGLYARVLGRPVRAVGFMRPWLARALCLGLGRFSPAAGNQMGILWVVSEHEVSVDGRKACELFDVQLTSAEEFLRAKAALPPD